MMTDTASTKATAAYAAETGKRSGLVIGSKGVLANDPNLENLNAAFDDVQDTAPAPAARAAVKKTRFSLPGQDESNNNATTVAPAGRILRKFASRTRTDGRRSMSPSALSKVSTAAPSVASAEEEAVEETVEEVRAARESESSPPNRREIVAEDDHDFPQGDHYDEGFPPVDQDDDDSDLIPPPPPDSPDRLDEDEEDAMPEASPVAFPEQDDGFDMDDDDDDKEGTGFDMVDPETPESVHQERLRQEQQQAKADEKKKKSKKKKKAKETKKSKKRLNESVDDADDTTTKPPPKRKRKKKTKLLPAFSPKGMQAGPIQFEAVPVTDLKSSPVAGVRRSSRARCPPLAFWKGETYVWQANDMEDCPDSLANMPVPKAIQRALPTPYKKRKVTTSNASSKKKTTTKKGRGQAAVASQQQDDQEPFDSTKLRKKYQYLDDETANMWDDAVNGAIQAKVIARDQNMVLRDLPMAKSRKKSHGKVVGKAASAFNIAGDEHGDYVGYIMGSLTLPPKGIKDSESVGACAQTFTVVSGQNGVLEVAYGDPDEMNGTLDPATAQRFLLGPKDMFRIPPGNCYRLENHSKSTDCFLTWTIIRSVENPNEGGSTA